MARSARTGILFAFMCLAILGAMPILSNARPASSTGLIFSIWLTVWQLAASLPLFLVERRGKDAVERQSWKPGTIAIALFTGALFGLSTYMYVVAAEKAARSTW